MNNNITTKMSPISGVNSFWIESTIKSLKNRKDKLKLKFVDDPKGTKNLNDFDKVILKLSNDEKNNSIYSNLMSLVQTLDCLEEYFYTENEDFLFLVQHHLNDVKVK